MGLGRMTRPEARSSEQYGFFGKSSMLTGDSRVGRLDAVDVFIVRSPPRVDGKPITASQGRDKRRKAGAIPGFFFIVSLPFSSVKSLCLLSFLYHFPLCFSTFLLAPWSCFSVGLQL